MTEPALIIKDHKADNTELASAVEGLEVKFSHIGEIQAVVISAGFIIPFATFQE